MKFVISALMAFLLLANFVGLAKAVADDAVPSNPPVPTVPSVDVSVVESVPTVPVPPPTTTTTSPVPAPPPSIPPQVSPPLPPTPVDVKTIFPDLSEHQPSVDFAALRTRTDAVGVRLSYGARSDRTMPQRINEVRAANFTAVMYYVFLRPSQLNIDQFATVTSLLPSLRAGESVWVDWEPDGEGGPTADIIQLHDILTKFDAHYKQPTGVYGPTRHANVVAPHRPYWVAKYGSQPNVAFTVWQYTDKNTDLIPGLAVDGNVFQGTAIQLAARNVMPVQ